ncbi:uncharacterized protein [Triticum aestivum]|uniref:uncharacterized protein isoform X1 n=1 Tax=Triticum aestivum TaxID=4565 RepID=UPI001D02E1FA|nr:uncharacterized protein LOC123087247 isoform X1 [Triticum aestivum]
MLLGPCWWLVVQALPTCSGSSSTTMMMSASTRRSSAWTPTGTSSPPPRPPCYRQAIQHTSNYRCSSSSRLSSCPGRKEAPETSHQWRCHWISQRKLRHQHQRTLNLLTLGFGLYKLGFPSTCGEEEQGQERLQQAQAPPEHRLSSHMERVLKDDAIQVKGERARMVICFLEFGRGRR